MTDLERALPVLRRYALFLTRDRDRAADLVQDCAVRALEKAHLFRAGSGYPAWARAVMHNVFIDGLRRGLGHPATDATAENLPILADQEDVVFAAELRTLAAGLPKAQRETFEVAVDGGADYAEIARRFGVPYSTARSRVWRVRAELRRRAA